MNGNGVGKGLSRLRRVEQDSIYRADTALDAAEQKHQSEERQGTEKEVEQESVGAPFAVPGTLLSFEGSGQGVAPLLLEGEVRWLRERTGEGR